MFSKKKEKAAPAPATPKPVPPTPTFDSVTCVLSRKWLSESEPQCLGVKVDCSDDALERKMKKRVDALNRFFAESALAGEKLASGKVKSLAISLVRSFGFSAPFIVLESDMLLVFEKPRAESRDDEDDEEDQSEENRKGKDKGKDKGKSTTTATATSTATPY
jgi:hypothetical protein